jgi:hypothetical protein
MNVTLVPTLTQNALLDLASGMLGVDRPIGVTAKHPGCYTYSIGACTAGTINGMCGNADTQLIVSAN